MTTSINLIALVCTECGKLFDIFNQDFDHNKGGIPIDRDYRCKCGSTTFKIVDGDGDFLANMHHLASY